MHIDGPNGKNNSHEPSISRLHNVMFIIYGKIWVPLELFWNLEERIFSCKILLRNWMRFRPPVLLSCYSPKVFHTFSCNQMCSPLTNSNFLLTFLYKLKNILRYVKRIYANPVYIFLFQADYYAHPEHFRPIFHEKVAPYASVIGPWLLL